ncbi:MAG: DEAD/DEAH box helicase [Rhizobium sp.]
MASGKTVAANTPPAAIAARLTEHWARRQGDKSLLYIARSEAGALDLAQALSAMAPNIAMVHIVPWDCLPYDRVGPSAEAMGRRMQALWDIRQRGKGATLVVASLDAILQRVPPVGVLSSAFLTLTPGEIPDLEALRRYAESTGYLPDELVDEPGEIAFRADRVDIFPPASPLPARILIDDDGRITEIKNFDPTSQRTLDAVDLLTIGPASELVEMEASESPSTTSAAVLERSLGQHYGMLETVFDHVGGCDVCLAPGMPDRLAMYLDIIDEARQAFGDGGEQVKGSLYLNQGDWDAAIAGCGVVDLNLAGIDHTPRFLAEAQPRQAFDIYAQQQVAAGFKVLVAGDKRAPLVRRLERWNGAATSMPDWQSARGHPESGVLHADLDIDEGFVDSVSHMAVITASDVLGARNETTMDAASALLAEPELTIGDLVVHEDHGIGVFRALEMIEIDGISRDAMRLDYHDEDSILVPIEEFGHVWRYGSEEGAVTLDRLHSDAWTKKQAAITKDIRATAKHLIGLASLRESAVAAVIVPPRAQYQKFAARFPYAETADQGRAIDAVLADLGSGKPMNRLICGDVGFGKTEIALRAAAAVALSGKQVVLLAPTTVLARQHFETFTQRFAGTGIEVAMLSRLVSAPVARQVKQQLQDGDVSIVIATQAILAKDIGFADLALVIIDEEHRFGAKAKKDMGALAGGLHQLTMTATPIPRTLQSAMIGIQEVSILATPPVRRRPIRTFRRAIDLPLIKVALLREKRRGGQSFVVVPRIEDIDGLRQTLQRLVPDLSILAAHGKMPAAEMDEAMVAFGRGDGDILLSTNIIENGLDIPRANTMLIWHADRFGLAQLHQLRGRVGRGRAQGVAYLLSEAGSEIADQTAARLDTMVTHDRLGDGLAISARDLDQRGAGDLVGEDQAGHLKLLGVSLYQHLLARAVSTLRGDAGAYRKPAELNLGVVGAIPDDYVKDSSVRINLYARLLRLTSPVEVDGFAEELIDRFGELPAEADVLLQLAKLRLVAMDSNVTKVDVGPLGAAVSFGGKPTARQWKNWTREAHVSQREERLFAAMETEPGQERLKKVAAWLGSLKTGR